MEIIPVIDLMGGLAVHAVRGRRENYRPLNSPLCSSAEPRAVLEGLLGLHAFKTVYLADLDALMGKPRQTAMVSGLMRAFPDVCFWIDAGLPEPGWAGPGGRGKGVVGSESLGGDLSALPDRRTTPFILSLDFRDGGLLGPSALLDRPDLWPERVIVMSLARVGSGAGPDRARLGAFIRNHPGHRWVAAGGVRDARDLAELETLGVSQVLMASALHSGTVDGAVLGRFA